MVAQLSEIANKSFDYVILGGGTAGLTVAGRLVQNTDKSVLVLEAGEANLDDPKILLGGATWGANFGNPKYDWAFKTTPQKYSNDRELIWNRGKGLGGSSAINFCVWIKPPAADIDAWEELGNPGWNWKAYQKYTMRTEEFTAATEEQLKEYAFTHNIEYRGTSGPLKTTVPLTSLPANKIFLEALQKQGLRLLHDPYGGDVTGCYEASANLDRKTQWMRSYAATAYYLPLKNKPNYTVLTEATVARVLFSEGKPGEDLVATGVEFIHGGKLHKVHAKQEVVITAGALKSPQILELSGIGRRDVLDKIGVPIKVELPGVGENVQDHTFIGLSYELDSKIAHKTADVLRDPEVAKEHARLHVAGDESLYRLGITAFSYFPLQLGSPNATDAIVNEVTKYINDKKKSEKLPPGLAEQYDIQLRILKDKTLPEMELIAVPTYMTFKSAPESGKAYVTVLAVLQHPFSRGVVHAKSKDPLEHPEIDPHLFECSQDLDIFAENFKFARLVANTEPFKSGFVREMDPGPEVQTDEQIKEYLKNFSSTCYHACGSASMLPREKNGVVDSELRVYGTKNLRVADLSIAPLEVAAHTQATVYGIAEQMADILLDSA